LGKHVYLSRLEAKDPCRIGKSASFGTQDLEIQRHVDTGVRRFDSEAHRTGRMLDAAEVVDRFNGDVISGSNAQR
jgi:hypothetical protein